MRRAKETLNRQAERRAEKAARRRASIQKAQRNSDLLVLEPRMVFDAAAAATADQAADQAAEQQAADTQADSGSEAGGDSDSNLQQEAAAAAGIEPPSQNNEIAFVDGSVENVDALLEGIDPSVEVVMLDPDQDGVEQIASALQDRQDVDAIHILSHGDQGKLYLGNDVLDAASMQGEHLDELTVIRNALSADGDILVYGCDFTGGESGLEAAMLLGSITGADIAASTDATGADEIGGDWDLETQVGSVEARTITATDWGGLLASETVFTSDFEGSGGSGHVAAPYDGWSSNDGAVEVWRDGTNGWTSPFGDYRIELNEDPGNFFPDAGDVFRDINTIAGAEYTLNYSYGGRPGFDATVNNMNVVVDGTVMANETANAVGNTNIAWNTESVTFTGNGGVMRVSFEAAGVGVAGGRGMHLDNVSLTRANVGPAATNDSNSAAEDTTLTVNAASGLLNNDIDLDGDMLSVTQFDVGGVTFAAGATANLAAGDLTINSDGSYTFIPAPNFNGPVPVATYTVTDGTDTDTATLTVDVTPVNDAPSAVGNAYTTNEDTALSGNALTDDTGSGLDADIDGDALSIDASSVGTFATAQGGSATIATNGAFTYTPPANYNGPDSFNYTITDGALTDTATVTVTVDPVNDAPVATRDAVTTNEDTAIAGNIITDDTGAGIDSDADGDPLSVTAVSVDTDGDGTPDAITLGAPTALADNGGNPIGTLTVNADGSYTFTPAANYNGPVPQVTYSISDGNGATASSTLNITISPANDPPVAVDDLVLLDEDTTTSFNPLSNDSDPDGDVFLSGFTQPASGLLELSVGEAGSLVTDSDGTTVNLTGTYTNPVVFAFITTQNETAGAPVIARVSNVTDNSFDLSLVEPNSGNRFDTTDGVHGPESVSFVVLEAGVWTLADGTVIEVGTHSVGSNANSFTAVSFDHTFTSSPAVISQVQTDNNGIEFNNARQRSVSTGGYQVTNEPADYQSTAISTAETIGYIAVEAGTGSWSSLAFEAGVTSDSVRHGDTGIGFTNNLGPDVNFLGQLATFDGGNNAHLDASSLTGAGVNVSVQEDRTQDNEIRHTTERASWLAIGGNGPLTAVSGTNFSIASNDVNFSYTPADDVNGDQSFTYTIEDAGGVSDSATVTLHVAPVVDTVTDTRTVAEDSGPTVINVLANDNFEGPVTLTGVSSPANGTVGFDAAGNVTYTPNPNFNGIETLTYTVTENDLGVTETGTLIITVTPVNDSPTATDNTNTTDEDTSVSGNAITDDSGSGIDSDPENDTLTVTQVDGSAYTPGIPVTLASGAQVTFQPNGTYTYNPNGQFESLNPGDTATDTFTYQVSDGNGGFDTATVTVTITGLYEVPTLTVSSPTVTEGTDAHAVFTVALSNPSTQAVTVSLALTDGTATGTGTDYGPGLEVSTDGGATWTAAASATLPPGATSLLARTPITDDIIDETTETFDLTATVTAGTTTNADASATASIIDDDNSPTAADDTFILAEDTSLSIDILGNDNDPDNDPLTVTMIDGQVPAVGMPVTLRDGTGTVTLNANGTITFKPARDYNGPVVFDYQISDGANTATATVTGTVTPVDEPETSGTTFEQLQERQPEYAGPDGNAGSGVVPLGEIGGNHGVVLETVAAIDRDGVAPGDIGTDRIVIDTVNDISDLGAIAELPTDDRPTISHIRDVEKLRALAQSAERSFGHGFGLWDEQGLKGFSLRIDVPGTAAENDSPHAGQITLDTMIRDHVLFIEISNDLDTHAQGKITEYRVLQADGRPLPSWVHHTNAGALLAEVPVDVQRLDLNIIALMEDGSSIEQAVTIQTSSGEIQPLSSTEHRQGTNSFDTQLNTAVVGETEAILDMADAIAGDQTK